MAIFDETNIEDITVESLVGDGKKFKTVDDLAKGKAESDRVIQAREKELAELRDELGKRLTAEELFSKLQKPATPQPNDRQNDGGSPPAREPNVQFTDEELAKRVKSVLLETNAEERKQSNIEEVAGKLVEIFGTEDKANAAVKAKAAELGVSVQFLQTTAAQSPKAFYAQLGLTDTAPRSSPLTHGDVNTSAFESTRPGGVQPGTYAWYEAQRKERGDGWYFKPEVQNALMKDAFANPDGFMNR